MPAREQALDTHRTCNARRKIAHYVLSTAVTSTKFFPKTPLAIIQFIPRSQYGICDQAGLLLLFATVVRVFLSLKSDPLINSGPQQTVNSAVNDVTTSLSLSLITHFVLSGLLGPVWTSTQSCQTLCHQVCTNMNPNLGMATDMGQMLQLEEMLSSNYSRLLSKTS